MIIRIIEKALRYTQFRYRHPGVIYHKSGKHLSYYSQSGQDYLVSAFLFDYLKSANDNIILDIGCNHPKKYSNSYFLESYFGCKVFAVDPLGYYKQEWTQNRPNSTFIQCAVSDANGTAFVEIDQDDDMFSSITRNDNPKANTQKVREVTFDKLTAELGINEILYCSIDVEGSELKVLDGIDFQNIDVKCFTIENNPNGLYGGEQIRKIMYRNGFKLVARIGHNDDLFIKEGILEGFVD